MKQIKIYLELGKRPVTRAVSLTIVAGYILCSGEFALKMIWPVVGIFFLACGPLPDTQIVAIIMFFFSWQIPHFWLPVIKYGEEYTHAGLPSLPGDCQV